jgi:excisionase family DNA binding protein
MAEKIPHHANLRDVIRRGVEHLKAALDCGGEVFITLLEDHQAGDQAKASSGKQEPGPAPIPIDKRELTVKELAAKWGVSRRSIYQWTYTLGLPFKKMGRLICFDLIEAEAWRTRHREAFGKARLRVVK